ncbi:hypothetical protein VHN57_02320 [Sphingobium sp. WW5]|uniref:hypothetical protein n=1 Tax=unclassified Sphingobium TaxID=2611147 RepID=UPI003C218D07
MVTNAATTTNDDPFRFFAPRVTVTTGQLSVMRALAIASLCGFGSVEMNELTDVFDLDWNDVLDARDYQNEEFVGLDLYRDADGEDVDALVLEEPGHRYLKAIGMWPEIIDAAEALKPRLPL